jgi:hypothetical protein
MAKLSEVAVVVTRLAAVHGQAVSADQVKAFHLVLGEFPRLVLVETMARALSEIKFMPKPAEMRSLAEKVMARHFQAPDCQFDEAGRWVMFKHGYQSTDELTEGDIAEVYQEMARGAPAWMRDVKVSKTARWPVEIEAWMGVAHV